MSKQGKKIGMLTIRLNREIGRGGITGPERSKIQVELRLDSQGTFRVSYEGKHYEAKTQKELHDQVKAAVDTTIDLVWHRYIVIKYKAEASDLTPSGRTEDNSQRDLDLDEDRATALAGDKLTRWDREPKAITGISLTWDVLDFSDPFVTPEDKTKTVRMKRRFWQQPVTDDDGEPAGHEEKTGTPSETDDDVLPVGCMLWTPAREEFLRQVRDALGKLDARMVALFNGVGDELAQRIDLALQQRADRLLSDGDGDQ